LHSEDELQRIILHEMVHVKQKHTIDLVIGECLSIINWYNPFAWLIRNAIRQNLEFIADKNVLDKGYDKKEYQYLLLKVIGLSQYSIANNFSLPNLKKRIIMMNKMKSATRHLTRFLFALPLLSVVLLAFRNDGKQLRQRNPEIISMPVIHIDTIPEKPRTYQNVAFFPDTAWLQKPNKNNYIISIADNSGEAVVIIKDDKRKIVTALTVTDWNADKAQNEKKYGRITGVATVSIPSQSLGFVFLKSDSPNAQKPIYLVNGITQSPDFDVNSIEPSAIQSIIVFKGAEAIKRYGDNATHGAIVIELKSKDSLKTENIDVRN
jgi:hypothetical protein